MPVGVPVFGVIQAQRDVVFHVAVRGTPHPGHDCQVQAATGLGVAVTALPITETGHDSVPPARSVPETGDSVHRLMPMPIMVIL